LLQADGTSEFAGDPGQLAGLATGDSSFSKKLPRNTAV